VFVQRQCSALSLFGRDSRDIAKQSFVIIARSQAIFCNPQKDFRAFSSAKPRISQPPRATAAIHHNSRPIVRQGTFPPPPGAGYRTDYP
jgi:hypothetical protein